MRRFGLLIVIVLSLAGCGHSSRSSTTTSSTTTSPQLTRRCPPDHSYSGCANGVGRLSITARPPGVTAPHVTIPAGHCIIADVSNWQGHPRWDIAKPHICGGIFKAGEGYFQDSTSAYNYSTLKTLGVWHTAYWFVRPTGNCTAEGQTFVLILRRLGYPDHNAGPPVVDVEVPGIAGYSSCIDGVVYRAFGVHVVVYSAPGTWPGGSANGLAGWPASYGAASVPCLPFSCVHVAWQFAAPPYVYYYVPGLGYQDESINYTFTSLRPFAPKPKPAPPRMVCFGAHAQHTPTCRRVHAQAGGYERAASASVHAFRVRGCRIFRRHSAYRLYRQAACGVFDQRYHYFTGRASALVNTYS